MILSNHVIAEIPDFQNEVFDEFWIVANMLNKGT